jgi:hypothetical protein
MIRQIDQELADRLSAKSLDQALVNQLRHDFGYSPFESRAILRTVKETYLGQLRSPGQLKPGQMVTLAIKASEPPGKPLQECQFVPIVVTVHQNPDDEELRQGAGRQGVARMRRVQIQRVAWEAVAQETYLTVEDLAYRILNCGIRTIAQDLAWFREQGIEIPLRGQQLDIGRGVSHKVQAVELFIQRQTYTQIRRRINHSYQAIQRYIADFVAVVVMTAQDRPVFEISFLRQISPLLVREYQALYDRYNVPPHRERLAEIVARFSPSVSAEEEKGGQS